MSDTPVTPDSLAEKSSFGLWGWSIAGFFFAFAVTMFLPVTVYYGFLVRTTLWRFYLLEIQRAMNPQEHLELAGGNESIAETVAVQQLLLSTVGGTVAMGIGWVFRRFLKKP